MKRKIKTLKCMSKIETNIRILDINGSEGLEVGLALCMFIYFLMREL